MAKWQIYLIMMLVFIYTATALDMCEDTIEINTNCTMVTPTLNCTSYTYDIINMTNESGAVIVNDAALTNVAGNIYKFNFTQPQGQYLVQLCDDTTREVIVKSDESNKTMIGIIILLPMILGLFFLIGAATLNDRHSVLRIFLFLLSVPTFFVSLHMGLMSVVKFYNWPELQNLIGSTTYWIGWVFFIIIAYFLIYIFYLAVHEAAQKRREEIEY